MVRSVYIHIPFCKTICTYCDFCKLYYDKRYISKYLDSLEFEILSRYKGEVIDTIYIGGGTPTSLDYEDMIRLFEIIKLFKVSSNFEYSIESNLECLDYEKICLFKKYGINRVSLGVQSFNSSVLLELNRHHDKDMVFDVVNKLKSVGINNISIDLIYGVNDDISIIKNDILTFLQLDVVHVSCYSLIIEDNSIFGVNKRDYIDSDVEYDIYNFIKNTLIDNGYLQYEISNYSKESYQSRHNINYWNNGFYYGFGLGAVSYIDYNRINNTKNLTKYLNRVYDFDSVYEEEDIQMSNYMIFGLRKTKGVSLNEFYNKYNKDIRDVFEIDDLLDKEIIVIDGDYIKIDDKYLYLSNDILVRFII